MRLLRLWSVPHRSSEYVLGTSVGIYRAQEVFDEYLVRAGFSGRVVGRNLADHAHSSAGLLLCPCLRGQVGVVEPHAALWPAALLSRNARAVLVHSSRRSGSGEVAPELS